jgi:hypothetical protein
VARAGKAQVSHAASVDHENVIVFICSPQNDLENAQLSPQSGR